jgi:hypothetical protein
LREGFPRGGVMTAWMGWALAAEAVVVGYLGYGWAGMVLVLTVCAFWLLLQFSRALRVLRIAAANPVGQVANAVMFQAKLNKGMRLPDLLKLTRSLGKKLADDPETYVWADAAGDSVQVQLFNGRLTESQLLRHNGAPGDGTTADA